MVDNLPMDVFNEYFSRHIDLSAADRSPWIIAAAIVQTLIGLVYLLWGWRIFNIIVMLQWAITGAVLGGVGGFAATAQFTSQWPLLILGAAGGAVALAIAFALLAKILVRFIFALQAGFCVGGLIVLTAATLTLPKSDVTGYGVAAIALLALIVTAVWVYRKFAACVMAVMSLQGAVFAVAGLSMLVAAVLESNHAVRPLTALVAVVVLATPSFLYQRSRGQVMGQKASGGKSNRSSAPRARRKAA
jgi:hypothetical protein